MGVVHAVAVLLRTGRGTAGARDTRAGGGRKTQKVPEPGVGGDRLGCLALRIVGLLRGLCAVRGAGRGEFGAAFRRRRLACVVTGGAGGLPCGVPCGDRGLLGVVRGEGGTGRVGVRRGVVEPKPARTASAVSCSTSASRWRRW